MRVSDTSVASAASVGVSREWNRSARSSLTVRTAGGLEGTPTIRSVTRRVSVEESKSTTSWKAPTCHRRECRAHACGRSSVPPSSVIDGECANGILLGAHAS